MFSTGRLNLRASRWTPFYYTITFPIDLTGATLAAEIRDRKDGGLVRATLGNVGTSAQGLRILSTGAESVVAIQIDEATMEAMDIANDAGALGSDGVGFWDMHITPSGGLKFMPLMGSFTVVAGATNV